MEIIVDRLARDEHEDHLPVKAVYEYPVQRLGMLADNREVRKRHTKPKIRLR